MSAVKEGVGHTTEEWERGGNAIRASGRGVIAKCPVPEEGGVMEFVANARLIGAAPKLLDAARAAAQAIVEMEDMDHVQRMEWFETEGLDLYDLLRSAIEAATEADQ